MFVRANLDPGLSPCEANSGHWPRTLQALQLKSEPAPGDQRSLNKHLGPSSRLLFPVFRTVFSGCLYKKQNTLHASQVATLVWF